MYEAALIPIAAACDRLRGGWLAQYGKSLDLLGEFGYGLVLACLLGLPCLMWLPTAVLWAIGGRPGLGYPMGQAVLGIRHKADHPHAVPERWQVGFLANSPWVSLVIRGLIWALPALPLAFWEPSVLWLAGMALALPLGAAYDRLTGQTNGEWVRGAFMGALTWAA